MVVMKKILVLAALSAVLLFVARMPHRKVTGPDALEMLLKATGAAVVEGEVQYYASLEQKYFTMNELEEILLQVAETLGLQDGNVESGEGETYRVLDVTGKTAAGPEAQIVVQSNPGNEEIGESPQAYLLVICRDASASNIKDVAERLEVLLRPFAPGGRLSYFLSGELPGKRTAEEMSKIAETALSAVRGKIIEGMQEEDFLSLTVYTPLLDNFLLVEGDRFNLNMAVRYDAHQDRTVVWVGYPLIHASY